MTSTTAPTTTTTASTTKPAPLPTLPTWWGVWARSAGSGSLIIAAISLFMVLNQPGALGEQLALFALSSQAVIALIALPLSSFIGAPYAALNKLLDAGVPAEELPRDKVLTALRLPTRTFWVVLGAHVVFSGVFVVVSRFSAVLSAFAVVRDLIVGAVALGFISATAQAYLMARAVRFRIAPRLLPHGRIDHLVDGDGQIARTYVWQHLVLLIINLAFAWPALLWTLLHNPADDATPGAWGVLVVLWAVLIIAQVTGIMAAVAQGVGHIADRMSEVRGGRLDVQARIFELDTFGVLASDFNRMVDGLKQREQLKETFGRYVTQQVVDEILAGRVALGGELKTATVLFSDIRGFTRMSEKLTPQEVVAFLNEYLAAMVDVVIEHGGVLDKFIGDAVMAVFGAPVGKGAKEDAEAAVACAVAMGKKLDEMNTRRVAAGKQPIAIGIGVHTGELVAGNIGSPRRMQYTVIGDTVNVGSRLESLTKEHARRTLLSGATVALVKDKFAVVAVGRVPVRGRDEELEIFGLADEKSGAAKVN